MNKETPPAPIPNDRKATEFLANERTFLAWIRTSVSIVSLGFVVAKFGVWLRELSQRFDSDAASSQNGESLPIGVAMMAVGALLAVLAAWRYHKVNLAIERGDVSADRGLVILVTAMIVALTLIMIAYMVATTGRP